MNKNWRKQTKAILRGGECHEQEMNWKKQKKCQTATKKPLLRGKKKENTANAEGTT